MNLRILNGHSDTVQFWNYISSFGERSSKHTYVEHDRIPLLNMMNFFLEVTLSGISTES